MSKELNDLAKVVADEQSAIDGVSENTRTRVIRMGKRLRTMQRMQKKEQTETGQTWKDWCEEQKVTQGHFPMDFLRLSSSVVGNPSVMLSPSFH